MFAIAQNRRRLAALASPIIAATLFGTPNAEGPTAPTPHPVAAQRSTTGKIVDRLPGGVATPPQFDAHLSRSNRTLATIPGVTIALTAATVRDTPANATATATAGKPLLAAAAIPARPHKASPVVATLPPRRPASLGAPQSAVRIAATQQKRPSVASRMFAFVGSLAGLANPL